METFTDWLEAKLKERDWRLADLARRSGVDTGSISRILSGTRNPGPEVCVAIARALKEPPERVFRLAGLLPPLPGPEDDQVLREVTETVKELSPDRRRDALEYVRWRYRQQEED